MARSPYRLAFCSDLHLNFCDHADVLQFANEVQQHAPDALLITGDISEASTLEGHLRELMGALDGAFPVFFVLGNHDYYGGSIEGVRTKISEQFTYTPQHKEERSCSLAFLSSSGVIPLTAKTALVGHDGWYDGQYANWFASQIVLSDYLLIQDLNALQCPTPELRFERINALAQQATDYIQGRITKAFETFDHVVVATHVPPFRENAEFEGKISDDDWLPHFSSKRMGDMLLRIANAYPSKQLTVLCGHMHWPSDMTHTANLRCVTAGAEYAHPHVCRTWELL